MVVVIGAGASGLGTAWDLVLRGVPVTVVEAEEIGSGTSGRFHGLLHSGGRYAVSDPRTARQCRQEQEILRRIAPSAIEVTGGYFVGVGQDDPGYIDEWLKGTRAAEIPVRPASRRELEQSVPGIASEAHAAFFLPDSVLEGFKLLTLLRANIERRGGTILTHTRATAVHQSNGQVSGVSLDTPYGARVISCDAVVNAAGPWAGGVTRLFEDSLPMQLTYGTMLIFANRMVSHVVHRLAPPGDGDILVPHGKTVILGTTDVAQEGPVAPNPTRSEALRLMELGRQLFPGIDRWRVLRAFTGVRPLLQVVAERTEPHYATRDFSVINHAARGGLEGAFSLLGGKWTTFRLMGQEAGDQVCAFLEVTARSTTASTILVKDEEDVRRGGQMVVCECEAVTSDAVLSHPEWSLDELRRRTWFAMGPCQGTMCAHRAMALRTDHCGPEQSWRDLSALRRERDKGLWPAAWGDNARELAFSRALRLQTLAEEVWEHHAGE